MVTRLFVCNILHLLNTYKHYSTSRGERVQTALDMTSGSWYRIYSMNNERMKDMSNSELYQVFTDLREDEETTQAYIELEALDAQHERQELEAIVSTYQERA